MFHFLKCRDKEGLPPKQKPSSSLANPFSVLAIPGMFLLYKYNEFRRLQEEIREKNITEKELKKLNNKIDKLLAKIENKDSERTTSEPLAPLVADETDEECVICMSAKATMQTYPCGHKVICRKCFIKTIQVAVSQRCLPLKCVICRSRILNLRQSSPVQITTSKRSKSKIPRFGRHSKVYAK